MKETIFRYLCLILFFGFAFSINCLDERLKKSIDKLDINQFKKAINELKFSEDDINESLKIIDIEIEKNQKKINKNYNPIKLGIFGSFLSSVIIYNNLTQLNSMDPRFRPNFFSCGTIVNILMHQFYILIDKIKQVKFKNKYVFVNQDYKFLEHDNYYEMRKNISCIVLGSMILTFTGGIVALKFFVDYKLRSKIKKYNDFRKILISLSEENYLWQIN